MFKVGDKVIDTSDLKFRGDLGIIEKINNTEVKVRWYTGEYKNIATNGFIKHIQLYNDKLIKEFMGFKEGEE